MADIDNTKIEQRALNAFRTYLEGSEELIPDLKDHSTIPCWDGDMLVYYGKQHDKEHLIGKVSVQVKGHEVEHCSDSCKYSIEISDLRVFLTEPTIYIVCQEEKDSTVNKLFYRCLLPETIKHILKGKEKQTTASVLMKPIPVSCRDFDVIVDLFLADKGKQLLYAHRKSMSMEDVQSKGIHQFQFTIPASKKNPLDIMQYLSVHPSFVYALLDEQYGATIPIDVDTVTLSFNQIIHEAVYAQGRKFYDEISTDVTDGKLTIKAGSALAMIVENPQDMRQVSSVQVHCKSDNLEERIKEAEFIIAMTESGKFSIGEMEFSINLKDDCNIDQLKKQYHNWKELKTLLDILHVRESLCISQVKPEQEPVIGILIKAILQGELVHVPEINNGLVNFEIGNLHLLFYCNQSKDKEKCKIGDFFCEDVSINYKYRNKTIETTKFSYLRSDCLWAEIDNIPFENLITSYTEMTTRCTSAYDIANEDMLYMIKATDSLGDDKVNKRKTLLHYALELGKWLAEKDKTSALQPFYVLNQLQIYRRERDFNDEELKRLKSIRDDKTANTMAKVGASILLEDKVSFDKYKVFLSKEEKKVLKDQPIWKFAKEW